DLDLLEDRATDQRIRGRRVDVGRARARERRQRLALPEHGPAVVAVPGSGEQRQRVARMELPPALANFARHEARVEEGTDAELLVALLRVLLEAELVLADVVGRLAGSVEEVRRVPDDRRDQSAGKNLQIDVELV